MDESINTKRQKEKKQRKLIRSPEVSVCDISILPVTVESSFLSPSLLATAPRSSTAQTTDATTTTTTAALFPPTSIIRKPVITATPTGNPICNEGVSTAATVAATTNILIKSPVKDVMGDGFTAPHHQYYHTCSSLTTTQIGRNLQQHHSNQNLPKDQQQQQQQQQEQQEQELQQHDDGSLPTPNRQFPLKISYSSGNNTTNSVVITTGSSASSSSSTLSSLINVVNNSSSRISCCRSDNTIEKRDLISLQKVSNLSPAAPISSEMGVEMSKSSSNLNNETATCARLQNLLPLNRSSSGGGSSGGGSGGGGSGGGSSNSSEITKSFQMRQQQRSDPTSDVSDCIKKQQQFEQKQICQHQQQKQQVYQQQHHQQKQELDDHAGPYYYPKPSPNNPFLPEIIAKNYNNDQQTSSPIGIKDVGNVVGERVGIGVGGIGDGNDTIISDSNFSTPQKLGHPPSTPLSFSMERTEYHHLMTTSCHDHLLSGGIYSSRSAPTGEGHSKMFTLNSSTASEQQLFTKDHKTSPQLTGQNLNPFLKSPYITSGGGGGGGGGGGVSSTSGAGSVGRTEKISSSGSGCQTNDLNTKREEFLKATMKICLVVSPPSNKLQLKSKSLTHLDTLDSLIACHQQGSPIISQNQNKPEQLDISGPQQQQKQHKQQPYYSKLGHHQQQQQQHQVRYQESQQYQQKQISLQQQQHHYHPSTCNKICCLGGNDGGNGSGSCGDGGGDYSGSGGVGGSGNISEEVSSSHQSVSLIQNISVIPNNPLTINSQGVASLQKKKMYLMNRKKPLLTRSEVSSAEYFSVYFCTDDGGQDEELILITKGMTLAEALNDALKKRKLNLSQITISENVQSFTESASPPYYTSSLDENTDVESLAGKLLIVTEKEGNKKYGQLQKAASFGSRTRPPKLLSSASADEPTTTEIEQKAIPGKQLKQRWSGLFGLKNPQQNQLCELLNFYAKHGVPQKATTCNIDISPSDPAILYLNNMHKSWKEFVYFREMSEKTMRFQTAIWELVTTEVYYIHSLQTVTNLFLACLEALQEEKLLTDVDQNKLFSNIRDICEANLKFWTYYIYPMVSTSIETTFALCLDYFQTGFTTFSTIFAPYKKYCADQSTCQFYCKELNRNNPLFTAYLAWCESQRMCNRLRLSDILVRPMQRLTKYSLLLSAIRRHVTYENDADSIDSMIHSVESFVTSVNTHLTTRQENERLKGIMARIESYDVVDLNNEHLDKLAKQYCNMLDLCSPIKGCANNQGRYLFMEGDLKLKDNQGKIDVHCFLLTDILLICKTVAKKGQGTLKVIRQPYLTDRLIVKHKDNALYCVYLNEFQMVITAFTLQCTEAKSWHDSITKAKHIYTRLKQGNSWDGYNLRYVGDTGQTGASGGGGGGGGVGVGGGPGGSGPNGGPAGSGCVDTLGIKRSPLNSSIGSRVSSLNNSHSGSVEIIDSRNISVDFEKTNSVSSDEGSLINASPHKLKTSSPNMLVVQPLNSLGQSLPNLNLHPSQASNLYHTYSNNTLLVPGTGSSHSGNLLSPSHRGISYPPPSPTRACLRRGFAFSSSIKNPPLVKTRNITSQNSINWHQTPATPTSPQLSSGSSQQQPPIQAGTTSSLQQQSGSQIQQQQPDVVQMAAGLKASNESDV